MFPSRFPALASLALLFGCAATPSVPVTPPPVEFAVTPSGRPGIPPDALRIDYAGGSDHHADWALALPPPGGSHDWIVCLHGHGSQGDQLFVRPDMRDGWLPAFRETGCGILTPNLHGNNWMGPAAAEDLHELLTFVRGRWKAQRFLLVGGSMGGTGCLIHAVVHPEDVAGVVALCPASDPASYHDWCRTQGRADVRGAIAGAIEGAYGGPPAAHPERYAAHSAVVRAGRLTVPVFVAHGAADGIIPVDQSRSLARVMDARKTFRYVEIPGGDHEAPLQSMREGLEWVLAQVM